MNVSEKLAVEKSLENRQVKHEVDRSFASRLKNSELGHDFVPKNNETFSLLASFGRAETKTEENDHFATAKIG